MDRIDELLEEIIEAQNSATFLAGQGKFGGAKDALVARDRAWQQIADGWREMKGMCQECLAHFEAEWGECGNHPHDAAAAYVGDLRAALATAGEERDA